MSEKIWGFIEKHKFALLFMTITVLSILIRVVLINNISNDYESFLKPWFYELKNNGGFAALSMKIGNYNMPYLTVLAFLTYLPLEPLISIKLVSIIFDYICAYAVMGIVRIIFKNNKHKDFISLIFYAVTLFLPTVVLNSACWGQADSIYTAFVLLAIYQLMKNKYIKAFIFLGCAFAFKLQFIFILPLFILIYITNRNIKFYHFLIIPAVSLILCLPAIIAGRPIGDFVTIYTEQTSTYKGYLTLNLPNVYSMLLPTTGNFVLATNKYIEEVGKILTIFVFAIMAFLVLYKKLKFDKQKIIEFGLWSVMISTFLLPQMHERYLFIGDILSILYFIYNRNKIYVPIGVSFISIYGYARYLFGANAIPMEYVSVLFFVLIVIVTRDLYLKNCGK